MAASICSTFAIYLDSVVTAGGSIIITNPGRTLRVMEVRVTGLDGAQCKLLRRINGATGTQVGAVTLNTLISLTGVPMPITAAAHTFFTAADDLEITADVANVSSVVIVCAGNPSQALTLT